jgi:hypothetical protein
MGYFDTLGSNSITLHLGTVTEVDLSDSTKVYVILDDQTDTISETAAIPMEVPSPIPKDTLGSGMIGIPRKGQRCVCVRLGMRDEYVILSYFGGTSEYGQDGRFILDGREDGEVLFAAGGYYNPLIKIKPKGIIQIRTDTWASVELNAEERRVETVAKRIYQMTPGSKDKKRYYDTHPVSQEDDRLLHSYVMYDGKQQESAVDDELRLEEETLLSLISLADKYNPRVIKLAGHIAYGNSNEIPGHVYEKRTQQSRGDDKKKTVFTEQRIGRQDEHTIEKDKLAFQTFKYPEGTIYDFRVKDKEGIDKSSPFTYMERVGHLSGEFNRNGGTDDTKGELYSSRLCFQGDLNVKPGDGWYEYNEVTADQSYALSLGKLVSDNTFKRVRFHSGNVSYEEEYGNNEENWSVVYNDEDQVSHYRSGFGRVLEAEGVDEPDSYYRFKIDNEDTKYETYVGNRTELYREYMEDSVRDQSMLESFGRVEDESIWRSEVHHGDTDMNTYLAESANLYERTIKDEGKDIKITDVITDSYVKTQLDQYTTDLNQYLKITKDSIVIEDQVNGNKITLDDSGITMTSTQGGCSLVFNDNGVTINTDEGNNVLTMRSGGTQVNSHYLATHDIVDFFNSHKGHLGRGNKGFAVPFHTRTKIDWAAHYGQSNTYKTNR